MSRKAASSMLAEALLIAIAAAAALSVYAVVLQKGAAFQGGASVSVSRAEIQSLGKGLAMLTVSVTNTGSVPELVGIYVSGLSGSFAGTQGSGYLYVAYANLPGGTYCFYGASEVFINGPSTGYSWRPVSSCAQLQSGAYEVSAYSASGMITNMPGSTVWLVTRYAVPPGGSLRTGPISLLGAVVTGEGTASGSSPLCTCSSRFQAGIPAGVLAGGQSAVVSVLVSGNYSVGQTAVVVAEAWTASGSESASSISTIVT